jgi:hypothetical protein
VSFDESTIRFLAGDDFTEEEIPAIIEVARQFRRHIDYLAKQQGVPPESVRPDVKTEELEKALRQTILRRNNAKQQG